MRSKLLICLTALAVDAPALAQQPAVPKDGLTLTHELRLRGEQRDTADFSSASANDPRDLLGRLRIGAKWTFENGSSIFFQPQLSVSDSRRSVNGFGLGNRPDTDPHIHQLYTDQRIFDLKWRLGRQEISFGDERLAGAANWLNKGRSWDAARVTVSDARTRTDFFGGTLGQFDFKTNSPTFVGLYSTVTRSSSLAYDLYFLFKAASVSATASQTIYTVGTRPVFKLPGGIDAKLEAAYQFGSFASRTVSAYAAAAVVGYTPPSSIGLRVLAEYDYASGGNPAGTGAYHTFDQLFPTNHAHYGLADFVGWKNMQDIRIGAQAKPCRKLSLSLDGHYFQLADATDNWYGDLGRPVKGAAGTNLRDATGASGRELGSEIDVTASYAVSSKVGLSAGYARFMPGKFVKSVNGGRGDATDWFYFQALVGW
jgi:hypothetical protein